MKKILIIATSILLLMGCTKSSIIEKNSVGNETSTHYSKSFDYFDGFKEKNMNIDYWSTVDVEFEIEVEEGSLVFFIKDENDKVLYEIDSTQTVTVNNKGNKLVLVVEAKKAKGSFKVDWEE